METINSDQGQRALSSVLFGPILFFLRLNKFISSEFKTERTIRTARAQMRRLNKQPQTYGEEFGARRIRTV